MSTPSAVLRFLIGEPGWYPWYLSLWLSLLPGLLVWRWLGTMKPGAGPQGGLVAFAGLFTMLAALTLLGLVLAISYAASVASPGVGRYAVVLGIWMLVWGVAGRKIASTANRASLADASAAERARARWTYLFLIVATGAVGLLTLARLRAAALD